MRDDGILEIKENSSGSIVPDSPGGSAVEVWMVFWEKPEPEPEGTLVKLEILEDKL